MTDRPLAEQLWHTDIARLDGEFPALESVTDAARAHAARRTRRHVPARAVVRTPLTPMAIGFKPQPREQQPDDTTLWAM